MKTTFAIEDFLDSSDLKEGDALMITAEVDCDNLSVKIVSVSQTIWDSAGKLHMIGRRLDHFTDGTIEIWKQKVQDKYQSALEEGPDAA